MSTGHWFTDARFSEATRAKLEIAQDFIRCYTASRRGLTTLRILHSERNLQGDYAEWLAAELLGLQLAASGVQKTYDATDGKGRTYQIKARLTRSLDHPTSFDFRDITLVFDYLIGVFLERETYDLLGIIRVPYAVVREHDRPGGNRFRRNKQTQQDAGIAK